MMRKFEVNGLTNTVETDMYVIDIEESPGMSDAGNVTIHIQVKEQPAVWGMPGGLPSVTVVELAPKKWEN